MLNRKLKSRVRPEGLRRRERKLTFMMFLIFGCFLVTYMPSLVVKMVRGSYYYSLLHCKSKCVILHPPQVDGRKMHPGLHVFCYILNWSSVMMNPVIYVATQSSYRMAIRSLWIRVSHCRNEDTRNQGRRIVFELENSQKQKERMMSIKPTGGNTCLVQKRSATSMSITDSYTQ